MGVGRIILGGPHPRRPSSVPVTKILSTYAHCRHPQYFCAKTKTSNKSQFVCPCHLGTPEPLSKGGIYEINFSTDSNVKNTNKRDVEIPKKWNLPKAQWHTQDILQTPSCPSPGILQGHFFINTLHGLVQGGFLTCSAQSSELKRKTLLNQGGSFVHREFHGTESLIGCPSFFILVLKIGRDS